MKRGRVFYLRPRYLSECLLPTVAPYIGSVRAKVLMFFVVARDSEKDTFGVDGDTGYGGDDDPHAESTAFGLPPANRGTDNARGKVNTGITTGEMHPMKTMSEAKRPRPTVLYAKTPTSLCC